MDKQITPFALGNRSQLSFPIKRVLVEFVRFDKFFFCNFHNVRRITREVPSETVCGPGFWPFLGHEGSMGLRWFGEKGQRSFPPGSWQRQRASLGPHSSCKSSSSEVAFVSDPHTFMAKSATATLVSTRWRKTVLWLGARQVTGHHHMLLATNHSPF